MDGKQILMQHGGIYIHVYLCYLTKPVFKYREHSSEIHNQGHLNNGDHNPYSSAEDEDNAEQACSDINYKKMIM